MRDQPPTSKIIAETDGPIGRLIFNNPARHNAVSLEMWEAVTRIIDDFERGVHRPLSRSQNEKA